MHFSLLARPPLLTSEVSSQRGIGWNVLPHMVYLAMSDLKHPPHFTHIKYE